MYDIMCSWTNACTYLILGDIKIHSVIPSRLLQFGSQIAFSSVPCSIAKFRNICFQVPCLKALHKKDLQNDSSTSHYEINFR